MKVELKLGLLFNTLAIIINRFAFLSDTVSDFLCGAFVALGILLMVVSLLPVNVYDNLLYRRWIREKNA